MHAASETAYHAAEDVLRDALGAGSSSAMRVAEDFFGLSDLVRVDARLRRALTDPSRSAQDKSELARAAFGSSVTPETSKTVDALVAAHWSHPGDLHDVLEVLGIVTTMEDARRSGKLDLVEQEIFEVSEFLRDHRDLRNDLSDLALRSRHDRAELAQRIFAPHVSVWSMRLLRRGVGRTSHGRLLATLRRFAERASAIQARRLVMVESASSLGEAQVERLRHVLSRRFGEDVTINVAVDPSLIGGFRIVSGTTAVDSSLSTQVHQLKREWVH